MSVRLRLTLLYSAILALTLAAFSVVLYLTLARGMLGVVDGVLAEETQRLIAAGELRLDSIILPADRFAAPQTFVQARNSDGTVTARTDNLAGYTLPLSDAGRQAALSGHDALETADVDGTRLRIYTAPITIQGHVIGMVQMARSLSSQEESLDVLRRILILGAAIATVVAFGIGWALAGTALRPIDRITQTVRAIGGEHAFDRRVPYVGPPDELGRLAETLNEMLGRLETAYRQVGDTLAAQRRFVADASHELRTPLTTIRGNVALLQREPPISDDDRVAVLRDMTDESERLIRLVNGLLALARSDAGQVLPVETVSLAPLLDEVVRQIRTLAPDRVVSWEAAPDVAAAANRDALKQVLLILLDNAVKFSRSGDRIALRASVLNAGVAVSVEDTGAGIPSAHLPHVFERFYRASDTRSGEGYGLGLAIAKSLVEAHGGSIGVTGGTGLPTVFTITLPAASVS